MNNDQKSPIQCNKCRKWIEYNYSSGYSHRCSGRAKEIRKAAHRRLYSINSLRNRDTQIFGMHDLANDLDSVSVVYDPTANKLLRKEIEMNNRKREQVKQLVMAIDYAKKRILYLERLKRKDDYDILIKDNTNNTEPEVIENGYEIINQIVYSYQQSLEKYNKELDELLAPDTTGNEQYVPPKRKIYPWWKKS
jgi:hypothetical protein|nr:MAG TPA: hypothetical protein [Caudoviricetes sp.]